MQDKVYPKGYVTTLHFGHVQANQCRYVEMLEQQQSQLIAGLQELYSRLQRGESWPGQPLQETSGGHPLTHDILERLDLLYASSERSNHFGGFEKDCNCMQRNLFDEGAPFTQRRPSISSKSDRGHAPSDSSNSGTPTTRSFAYERPSAHNNAPPVLPMNSLFPQQSPVVSPIKQEPVMTSPPFMGSIVMETPALSRAPWINNSMMMDSTTHFSKPMYEFDDLVAYNKNMMADIMAINPNDPTMPDWNTHSDLDFSSFIQNPADA